MDKPVEDKPVELYQIVKELEESKEKVNELLKLLLKKSLPEREIEFNSKFETLELILKEIGLGLYKAAKNVTKKDDLVFYFWPGYTTIGNNRVLIKGKIDKFNEEGQKYYTGIGFKSLENSTDEIKFEEFFDCPSTLYFDAVLTKKENFIPPTTHNWKRQQPYLQIKLKEDNSNLKILIIEKGKKSEVISKKETLLHITFDAEEVGNSVEEIAKFLEFEGNNIIIKPEEKVLGFKKWPFNYDESKIIKNKNLEAAQKLIYPVWFAATFCDSLSNYDQNYGENNWLNRIKEKLCEFGYSDICQRIKDYQKAEANHFIVGEENYHNVNFTHWYSLFFDNYDSDKELGSAMFLTNAKLPVEFLYYVSPWLKFMYSQIRSLDSATLVELKTRKLEWEKVIQQMRHNIITHLGSLPTTKNEEERKFIVNDILEYLRLTKYISSEEAICEYLTKELNEKENQNLLIKQDIISPILSLIKTVIKDNPVLLLARTSIQNALVNNIDSVFLFDNNSEDYQICTSRSIARLIFKDLITNAIKNVNPTNPICLINFNLSGTNLEVIISNNSYINQSYFEQINNPNIIIPKEPDHWGIFIYKNFAKHLNWNLKCLPESVDIEKQLTTIILTIPLKK